MFTKYSMLPDPSKLPPYQSKPRKSKSRPTLTSPRPGGSSPVIPWPIDTALSPKKSKRVSFVDKAARWKWWSSVDTTNRPDTPPPEWKHIPASSGESDTTGSSFSIPLLHMPSGKICYQSPEIIRACHHCNTELALPHDRDNSENIPCCIPHTLPSCHSAAGGVTLNKNTRRRWTLSIDIADEDVSDEMFVQELERIRTADGTPFALSISGVSASDVDHYFSDDGFEDTSVSQCSSTSTSWPWTSARLVLLIVRELVRTERHYLSSLRRLSRPHESEKLSTPPLMSAYAQDVCRISEELLSHFEADMTVAGVCTAFARVLEGEDCNKQQAYIGWCSVVGEWFIDDPPSRHRVLRKARRNSVSFSRVTPRIPLPSFQSLPAVRRRLSSASSAPSPERKIRIPPAIRDLAILPTQRIARYVLLYRDLLAHTPSNSPTYPLVSHAVDVAVSLAQKCDRAQSNTAFLVR